MQWAGHGFLIQEDPARFQADHGGVRGGILPVPHKYISPWTCTDSWNKKTK